MNYYNENHHIQGKNIKQHQPKEIRIAVLNNKMKTKKTI